MWRFACLLLLLILAGCETAAVKNTASIRTKVKLDPAIEAPVTVPVVYFASQEERSKSFVARVGYQNYKLPAGYQLGKALDLVVPAYFDNAMPLEEGAAYHYLLSFKTDPSYDHVWGTHAVTLTLNVVDSQGQQVFNGSEKHSVTSGAGYSGNALFNAYAGALKKSFIAFLNSVGGESLTAAAESDALKTLQLADLKSILGDIKPSNTGTGFYVNDAGQVLTAAHVVDECVFIDINQQGQKKPAALVKTSKILDLAVLQVEQASGSHINLRKPATTLGMPVFVTGFPLSGIMSDYPSLTVGNISSMGGLRGAKGAFQFSAPAQPGNSGGPVVDYAGNLVGVVTGSLNQRMMLEQTGTVSQNVNFGMGLNVLTKFLDKGDITYSTAPGKQNFEQASQKAVEYTAQVLCYK